jgi:hypothetical protein
MALSWEHTSRTHFDVLSYRLFVFLDPPLDVHDGDEEAKVGAERVVVLLRLELV